MGWGIFRETTLYTRCNNIQLRLSVISMFATNVNIIVHHKNFHLCPSHPIVYTTSGMYVAACFTGQCTKCLTRYHHSYYETGAIPWDVAKYQVHTNHHTMQLTFSACSFESQATQFTVLMIKRDWEFTLNFWRSNTLKHPGGQDWESNVTRLEDGWFIYHHWTEDTSISRLWDVQMATEGILSVCQSAMLRIQASPPKWVQHECNVPDCKEGMVTVDGNEN